MFNNCSQCGRYSEEKHVDAAKSLAICPYCGYAETFSCFPLFVITGASGAGKTTIGRKLTGKLLDFVFFEVDVFWRDEFNQPENDHRAFRNLCLRVAKNINQNGRPAVLVGSATPGQYEACPEFRYFAGVHYLALVCEDNQLAQRLKERPAHRKSSSPEFIEIMQNYNRWFKEIAPLKTTNLNLLDTTSTTVEETGLAVRKWLEGITLR
jgi:shikimate kinase